MKNPLLFSVLMATISLLLLTSSIASSDAVSDYNIVSGTVTDAKRVPVPYIIISIKQFPTVRCASNIDGTFTLFVPKSISFPFDLELFSVIFETIDFNITRQKFSKPINIVVKSKPDFLEVFLERKKQRDSVKYGRGRDKDRGPTPLKGDGAFMTIESVEKATAASESSISVDADFLTKGSVDRSVASVGAIANISAGTLTAGELNDFTKWNLWDDITADELSSHQHTWKIFPKERFVAQVTNKTGMPIYNCKAVLKDNIGNVIWQSMTDNTGKAELWANLIKDGLPNFGEPYYLELSKGAESITIDAHPFSKQINTAVLNLPCDNVQKVDVDFIIDATGSMGDEINYLKVELYDVIEKVKSNNPNIDLNIGNIFYRDWDDEYLVLKSDLTENISESVEFIKKQDASGGGDYPEALDVALFESIEKRQWRDDAVARIIFIVLDAPPHTNDSCIALIHRQLRIAAMKGIRIVPLVCSGSDRSNEFLMRSIALATNGTYVFLTDDSGIGDKHLEPTTPEKWEVEKLNHILIRITTSFSFMPDCSNDWTEFTEELSSMEKFIPKPYKEEPAEGTDRVDVADLVRLYPVPTNGILNVELNKSVSHLYLSDMTGKVLQNFVGLTEGIASNFVLDMSGYSSGVYFINCYYEGRWYVAKFILAY